MGPPLLHNALAFVPAVVVVSQRAWRASTEGCLSGTSSNLHSPGPHRPKGSVTSHLWPVAHCCRDCAAPSAEVESHWHLFVSPLSTTGTTLSALAHTCQAGVPLY